MKLYESNKIINEFANLISSKTCKSYEGKLKVGVDLGTANIVISAVDQHDNPVAGVMQEASVVKDGIVVDFIEAVKIVKKLKAELESIIGVEITTAATAIPPGITEGNIKVITNVVEGADIEVTNVIDEPSAAATVLNIDDGAVVDVGGGTTGISIIRNGKIIFTADEPTGGTHMTLVLAGATKLGIKEAEVLKKDFKRESEVFIVIKPVIEKMASIVSKYLADFNVETVYVVGGACCFENFERVFMKELGIKTIKPLEPLLVTPLGIAMNN